MARLKEKEIEMRARERERPLDQNAFECMRRAFTMHSSRITERIACARADALFPPRAAVVDRNDPHIYPASHLEPRP